jgi:hypothetical protein
VKEQVVQETGIWGQEIEMWVPYIQISAHNMELITQFYSYVYTAHTREAKPVQINPGYNCVAA